MPDRTHFDRIRDELAGALSPDEREALLRELEADPELAELAEEYRLVAALTAHSDVGDRRSSTTFAELLVRDRSTSRQSRWRRVAAAAALVVAAGTAAIVWSARAKQSRAPIVLETIRPWREVATCAALPPELPAEWATYDPREDGRVHWIADVEEAKRLAQATERPLFVYGFYPGCPLAKALDEDVFTNAGVVGAAEEFVPVRMDLSRMPEAEAMELVQRGYPFLEAWCARPEETKLPLARVYNAERFESSLQDGLAQCPVPKRAPAWPAFRELVRLFEDARASLARGAPARAEKGFEELAQRAFEAPYFTKLAVLGYESIARDVHERYFRAHALASSDVAAAQVELERALEAYVGTHYESDLRRTLDRIRSDGRFPPVELTGGEVF